MALILVDSQTTQISYSSVANASDEVFYSTSFVASTSYVLAAWEAYVQQNGTPTMDVVAHIYSDDGGGNPNSLLGTSINIISASTFPASYDWVQFAFSGVSLANGTRYHLVLSNSLYDASNYYRWGRETGATSEYINKSADGQSWTTEFTGQQFDFRTYYNDSSGETTVTGSDTLALLDTSNVNIGLAISGTDSLSLADTASVSILLSLSASDNAVFSDTGSTNISIAVTGLDGLSLGDLSSSGGAFPVTSSDVIYFGDMASVQISLGISGSDSMVLGDTGTGGDVVPSSGVDNISFSDTASVNISVNISGSDSISLSEIESIIHGLESSGTDSLVLSDIAQSSGVISGILRLAIRVLGKSQTVITVKESHTIVTVIKI